MGCTSSAPLGVNDTKKSRDGDGPRGSTVEKSKGGSMMYGFDTGRVVDENETNVEISKGGSTVYGRRTGHWELGEPIVRPLDPRKPVAMDISMPVLPEPGDDEAPAEQPSASSENVILADLKSDSNPTQNGDGGGTCKLSVRYAVRSLQGRNRRPPHKPNQDSYLVATFGDDFPGYTLFAVFDGHGPYGEYASHYCRENLADSILYFSDELKKDPKEALFLGIRRVHEMFIEKRSGRNGVNPIVSGTTAIIVLFCNGDMHVANVGDSRAIALWDRKTKTVESDPEGVVSLSSDHKPARKDEEDRILDTRAVLLTEVEIRGDGDEDKVYVCKQNDSGEVVYGVLFSRSIGDADAHDCLGISAEPETWTFPLSGNDDDKPKYVVIASDGVWDQVSNEDVRDAVLAQGCPYHSCDALVRMSAARWEDDPSGRRDDITALIIQFANGEDSA